VDSVQQTNEWKRSTISWFSISHWSYRIADDGRCKPTVLMRNKYSHIGSADVKIRFNVRNDELVTSSVQHFPIMFMFKLSTEIFGKPFVRSFVYVVALLVIVIVY
jgi:hypothetical protein